MLELGVQLAACLMLWRVVRCGAAVPAVVHVQVGWLQSTRPLNPGRQVRMQRADRNGVGTSRDGQSSDNELGGVAKKRNRTRQGGRTGGVQTGGTARHGIVIALKRSAEN